jgi:hypothetical protein
MHSIAVKDIKDFSLSADASEATFTLATRYAGDLAVTLPAACLKNLKIPTEAAPATRPAGVAVAHDNAIGNKEDGSLTVTMPKTWMTFADAKTHGVVVIMFDHKAPTQAGFALAPDAAKELAVALVKHADAVVAGRPGKAK